MGPYPKYAWIGNQITKEQISKMVIIREETGKPLTIIIRDAVAEYLKKETDQ